MKIIEMVLYLLNLTLSSEVLWLVVPLFVATVVMLFYFERYSEERPGWNTYVANSLVLLFVSVVLFRYIYSLGGDGLFNFINYLSKFIVSLVILLMGIIILFLNFEHFLPEKIARYMSSPLTLNLVAYIAILYVHSSVLESKGIWISLIIIFILLIIVLNLIRLLLRVVFNKLRKMKEAEKKEKIIQSKKPIQDKKKDLKKEEAIIRKVKEDIKKEEAIWKKEELKELDKQKKEAVKLKKEVKK